MQILVATFIALAPGNTNGATASAAMMTMSRMLSARLRGGSPESIIIGKPSSTCHRIKPARPPHQDRDHQQDVGDQRQFWHQEAAVIGDHRDQQRADKAAADRAEPA